MLIPSFSRSCVKDFIVSMLCEEWPLTAKKIYYDLKKTHNISITYQAIFKALQELVKEGILIKNEMSYEINLTWTNYLHDLAEKIKSKYLIKNKLFTTSMEITKIVYNFDPRIMKFIDAVGERVYNFVNNSETVILTLSGNGYFGSALKNYLESRGKIIDYAEIDRNKLNIYEEDVENKKIVIVDGAIYTGATYKKIMEKLREIKKKCNIKDYIYVVEYDMLGLADISSETLKNQPMSLSH